MSLRTIGVGLTLLVAASMVVCGCGGGGGGTSAIGPTVVSVSPKNNAFSVSPTSLITATFNTEMFPASFNPASFWASAPGVGHLPGAITFSDHTATLAVTNPMPQGTLITVTITTGVRNLANQYMAENYVWSFTTGTTSVPPTIVSTVPTASATGVSLSSNVSATFSEVMNAASINGTTFTLAGPGGIAIPATVSYVSGTAVLNSTAPLVGSTIYTATVTSGVKDVAGLAMVNDYKWSFTTAVSDIAPTVVSTIPVASATGVSLSTNVSATFSEAMNPVTVNGTSFTLTGPGGSSVAATVTYANGIAVLNPAAPLAGTTVYTATVTTGVKDVAGTAMVNDYKWSFTTAAADIAPTVISTVPASSAIGIPLTTAVTATFSEAMNVASINGTTFTLSGPGGTSVAATVTYANSIATLNPTNPLAGGTTYTATVTNSVKDVAGTPMVNNYTWTFTTDIAPTVVSAVPINLATNVLSTTNVSATFSEAMNAVSISGTTFTLTAPGGVSVPATVTYANKVATLSPTSALLGGTTYTATVTNGVKDLIGTSMVNNYTWTFTTDVPPTVASTTPVNLATQVGVKNSITATFSKAMNPASINGTTFTLKAPGGLLVAGTVSYSNNVATLVPTSPMAGNTLYTATVTNGVKDVAGTAMVNSYTWTFTTGQAPINLGTAGTYGVLAGSTVTSTGPTIIKGDLGVSPGTAITGFPPGTFTGTEHAGDAVAAAAKADLLAAYADAVGRLGANALPGDVSGITITPGLYKNSTSVMLGVGSNVTFDAKGDINAVFILQMGSTLTTGVNSTMTLAGGAQPGNIYWSVGSSATLGVSSSFVGTILSQASITANTGMTLNGRLLTNVAAVTLDSNTITLPPPSKRKRI